MREIMACVKVAGKEILVHRKAIEKCNLYMIQADQISKLGKKRTFSFDHPLHSGVLNFLRSLTILCFYFICLLLL